MPAHSLRADSMLPNLAVVNNYFLGDGVLLEPEVEELATGTSRRIYVLSRHKDLYAGHPNIVGIEGTEPDLPEDLRYVVLDGAMQELDGKRQAIRDALGLRGEPHRAPRLYLTQLEHLRAAELAGIVPGPRIGVVWESRRGVKSWNYMAGFVRQLAARGYAVFLIGDETVELPEKLRRLPFYSLMGKRLREMMIWLGCMDAVVGSDTGPIHVASALGVPTVVICLERFGYMYEQNARCTVLTTPVVHKRGIRSISVRAALDALEARLEAEARPAEVSHTGGRHAVIRIRGIGDLFLLQPGLATLRSLDGKGSLELITSKAIAELAPALPAVDAAVGVDYSHGTWGLPVAPQLDYSRYSTVTNLINSVDFVPSSGVVPRTELFGRLLGLECVRYDTDWKMQMPDEWRREARGILSASGLGDSQVLIGLQIGSAGLSRMWPKARWKEFIGRANRRRWKVVALSDKSMRSVPQSAINLTGQLTVRQYAAVIAETDVFVGPDSSGVHIAGCLDKDAVALFGSVDPELRVSHYDSVHVIRSRRKCVPCNDWIDTNCEGKKKAPMCMWDIKPDSVIRVVAKLLRSRREVGQDGATDRGSETLSRGTGVRL